MVDHAPLTDAQRISDKRLDELIAWFEKRTHLPVGASAFDALRELKAIRERRLIIPMATPPHCSTCECGDDELLVTRLSGLLTEIAVAVKGPPPPDTSWSWHDLPDLVRKMALDHMAELDQLRERQFSLDVMAKIFQHWLEFHAESYAKEGCDVSDASHIISPPAWPSRGQLKAWIAALQPRSAETKP